jgi:hypothetical protein
MATQLPRRRSRSPVGRKRIRLNDVSAAAAAGSIEFQRTQLPYLNKFMAALRREYPQNNNTTVESAQTKVGTFVVPVWSAPDLDFVAMAQRVKREFPEASVVPGESPGEALWRLPYLNTAPPRKWGDILFLLLLLIIVLAVPFVLSAQKEMN